MPLDSGRRSPPSEGPQGLEPAQQLFGVQIWWFLTATKRRTLPTVLAGKLDDRLPECIFVFTPHRTIALCAARLVGNRHALRPVIPCFCCA